ncbi:peroxiredoxin family protein [Anaerolinea sp.]|uniref:peroxiredoxin family protein n=1 Tax=Anaerolinea sp. TaxID=1872519 RepID=UPI002ACD3837|nr:redoxin domain-containing protein [Anaerolinea sp.]
MTEKSKIFTSMLMGTIFLLFIAVAGLFIRVNQLQNQILVLMEYFPVDAGQNSGLSIDTNAPDFTLPNTDGKYFSLHDFLGQKILLGFSSIDCPYCKKMYPELRSFSKKSSNLQIVLISRGTLKENQELVQEQQFNFPILTLEQGNSEIGKNFQVPGTPFFYVIDEVGKICSKGFANTEEHLEELIRKCNQNSN